MRLATKVNRFRSEHARFDRALACSQSVFVRCVGTSDTPARDAFSFDPGLTPPRGNRAQLTLPLKDVVVQVRETPWKPGTNHVMENARRMWGISFYTESCLIIQGFCDPPWTMSGSIVPLSFLHSAV